MRSGADKTGSSHCGSRCRGLVDLAAERLPAVGLRRGSGRRAPEARLGTSSLAEAPGARRGITRFPTRSQPKKSAENEKNGINKDLNIFRSVRAPFLDDPRNIWIP